MTRVLRIHITRPAQRARVARRSARISAVLRVFSDSERGVRSRVLSAAAGVGAARHEGRLSRRAGDRVAVGCRRRDMDRAALCGSHGQASCLRRCITRDVGYRDLRVGLVLGADHFAHRCAAQQADSSPRSRCSGLFPRAISPAPRRPPASRSINSLGRLGGFFAPMARTAAEAAFHSSKRRTDGARRRKPARGHRHRRAGARARVSSDDGWRNR